MNLASHGVASPGSAEHGQGRGGHRAVDRQRQQAGGQGGLPVGDGQVLDVHETHHGGDGGDQEHRGGGQDTDRLVGYHGGSCDVLAVASVRGRGRRRSWWHGQLHPRVRHSWWL